MGDETVISSLYLKTVKNYFDIILPCLLRHKSLNELRDMSDVDVKSFASESKIKLYITDAININDNEFNEKEKIEKENFDYSSLNIINNFKYNDALLNIPKILSVSDIKEKNVYFKRPSFMSDGVNYAKKGTLYHRIFELLPIKKYSIKSLEEELDNMVKSNALSKNERHLIDIEKIFSYLTSDIYDIMKTACKVLRE